MHSTIISLGSWVSDFARNSHERKLNKAQTKRANITGAQHNSRVSTGSGVTFLLSFLLYFLFVIIPTFRIYPWRVPAVAAVGVCRQNTMSDTSGKDTVAASAISHPIRWAGRLFVGRFYAG